MKKFLFLFILFLLLFPKEAIFAKPDASLFLSPSSRAITAGQTFSVSVYIGSKEAAVNAGQAKISYSKDRLQFLSFSKSGSIFQFWPEEPSIGGGMINFAGGLPTPGYKGGAGKILTMYFKAKSVGTAEIKFESGAILADDGKGTNLLSSFGNGKYSIRVSAPPAPTPPAPKKEPVILVPVPSIDLYSEKIYKDQLFYVQGTAEPNQKILIYAQIKDKEKLMGEIYASKDGKWSFIYPEKLVLGTYKVWAQAEDKQGNKSEPSKKIEFSVVPLGIFRIGKAELEVYFFIKILIIVAITCLLIIILQIFGFKNKKLISRIKKITKKIKKRS